MHAMK